MVGAMVTDDYRAYRKGVYVRFRKNLLPAASGMGGLSTRLKDPIKQNRRACAKIWKISQNLLD
jgi:hypothetical protein